MAFCKNCGQGISDVDNVCSNCGVVIVRDVVDDLDTEAKIQGGYIFPGSPGYVPPQGIKVISHENQVPSQEPVYEAPQEPVYEVPQEPTYEEPPHIPQSAYAQPQQEEFSSQGQGGYIPPQQGGYAPQDQGYVPPQQGGYAPQGQGHVPPQQGGYAPQGQGYVPPQQGGYAPQGQTGYAQPQHGSGGGYVPPPGGYGGQSGGGDKKNKGKGLVGILVGLLALLLVVGGFFVLRGRGSNSGSDIVGEWEMFAFGAEDFLFSMGEEGVEETIVVFEKDGTTIIDNEEDGTWEEKKGKITVTSGTGEYAEVYEGAIEDGVMTLSNGDSNMYLSKVGSKDSDTKIALLEKAIGDDFDWDDFDDGEDSEDEDDNDLFELEPRVDASYWEGNWEGVILQNWPEGSYVDNLEPKVDITGVIEVEKETGKPYLEIYDGNDDVVLSMYIKYTYYGFEGIAGEEDAWIFQRYLTQKEAQSIMSSSEVEIPTILITYEYKDPNDEKSGFDIFMVLRKEGASWDDMEIKPSYIK
ncbi:MAG: hypothetical protein GXZ11_06260 [Tissierellia bacterium]|nr:hypothetical protein [Tissierellia bacterium]